MSVAMRIARRELRGGLRGFRVFLACLTLGIAAIAAVGSVREAISDGLNREGATLLGGDVSVEINHRLADATERAALDGLGTVSETVEFSSMIAVPRDGDTDRGLTEIKGVDALYPLYGEVGLDPPMPLDDALANDGVVMAPVLMERLGLAPGDAFRIGTKTFRLSAALVREPDNGGGFSFAPRTLMRTGALEGTGLLGEGTLFESEYRVALPPDADLATAEERFAEALPDRAYRWRDRRNGAPGVQRFVDRLSSFLVLVGLAGLAVGGVGVASAVRAHMVEKTATIATLKTLGAESRTIFAVYAIQIGVLSALGIAMGLVLGAALPLVFAPVIAANLPVPATFSLYPRPLAEAALYGALAAALFTLWPLAKAQSIRAAALFRDAGAIPPGLPRPAFLAATAALLAALVASAALLSGLPELSLYTAAGLGAAFAALLAMAALLRATARRLSRLRALRGRSALRLALGAIGGPGGEATSVVLSLGLGLTVLASVGQIDTNLRSAIEGDLPQVAPSYFVLDIQPDQIEGFRERLARDPSVGKVETAPILRGVVTRINGRDAEEVAGEHWVLRGDRGVTYADAPDPGTEITEGAFWPPGYDGPTQISFAAEEGAELGLTLGDRLTVNILGRDIEGEITSFREVDFSNAGMGFVLTMSPAALAGAPHTWLATIYADEDAEAAILSGLADAYPNITAIRVRDFIDRVATILEGIAAAVTYGASATLATGAVVLLGASAAGIRARTFEAAMLKTLGASRATILLSFALRWALLGLAAGLVAVVAGGIAGWAVSRFVMETDFTFAPLSALAIVGLGILGTLLAGLAFAWSPLAARPARVLRARD